MTNDNNVAKAIPEITRSSDSMDLMVKMRRQTKRNRAQKERRRAAGMKDQSQSAARLKPWEAAGMSRAQWYRKQKLARSNLVRLSVGRESDGR